MEEYWASYLADLVACLLNTTGPVLEVGAGKWSTPILRDFCKAAQRDFVSLDSDPAWRQDPTRLVLYDDVLPNLAQQAWSVVFLDHSPGERRPADALLFADSAEYVVAYDYAPEVEASFEPVLKRWAFHKVSDRFSPRTLVLGRREIPRV